LTVFFWERRRGAVPQGSTVRIKKENRAQ
jgi:hypothetical protein